MTRVPDLGRMHIRLHPLRYVYHEPMCSVWICYENDGNSFHDQDEKNRDLSYDLNRQYI